MALHVQIQKEEGTGDLPLPRYATEGAAGMDLRAAVEENLILMPGARANVSTGIRIVIPEGFEAQVRPRSGLAWRQGIGMVNSPGTIDSDYRGVVSILLINWGDTAVTIRRGDRIGQLVVAPVARVEWIEHQERSLPLTQRQEGGFGHTGLE